MTAYTSKAIIPFESFHANLKALGESFNDAAINAPSTPELRARGQAICYAVQRVVAASAHTWGLQDDAIDHINQAIIHASIQGHTHDMSAAIAYTFRVVDGYRVPPVEFNPFDVWSLMVPLQSYAA